MEQQKKQITWMPVAHRQRVYNAIEYALQRGVVLMADSRGMGKTTALKSYFACNPTLHPAWIHFTSINHHRDRFWSLLVGATAGWDAELSADLDKMGFPFLGGISSFISRLTAAAKRTGGAVIVLDNFEMIPSGVVKHLIMTMIERTYQVISYIIVGGDALVVHLPDTIVPAHITNRELNFSRDELHAYYSSMGIQLDEQRSEELHELTGGWPVAVNLLGKRLVEGMSFPPPDASGGPLYGVQVTFEDSLVHLRPPVREGLTLLSMLEEIPLDLVPQVTDMSREEFEAVVEGNSLIHTYPRVYAFTTLYRRYLSSRLVEIPWEKRRAFLCAVASWFESRESALVAPVLYYCQAEEYSKAEAVMSRLNLSALSLDLYAMYEEILYRIPNHVIKNHRRLWVLRILFRTYGLNESKAWAEISDLDAAIFASGDSLTPADRQNLGETRLLFALLNLYRGKSNFSSLFREAANLIPGGSTFWSGSNRGIVINSSTLPQGHGMSMMDFVENFRQAAPYMRTAMGHGAGLEHLIACEVYYHQGDVVVAMAYVTLAIQTAEKHRQWDVAACACLFGVRSSILNGNLSETEAYLDECRRYANLERARGNPYMMVDDIAQWHFANIIGRRDLIADWIKDPVDMRVLSHVPNMGREFFPVAAQMSIDGKAHQALELINMSLEICNFNGKWMVMLYLQLLKALLYYKMSQVENAAAQLHTCYRMAQEDNIVMPFVEIELQVGKMLRDVRQLPESSRSIPTAWLDALAEKAEVFDRNVKKLRIEYIQTYRNPLTASLSDREMEAYSMLCADMRIKDIASTMGITDSTLKVTLFHAYKKLGVSNMEEAKQIAREAY